MLAIFRIAKFIDLQRRDERRLEAVLPSNTLCENVIDVVQFGVVRTKTILVRRRATIMFAIVIWTWENRFENVYGCGSMWCVAIGKIRLKSNEQI